MTLRRPIVAGIFYESDFSKLDRQITSCFTHEKGPGELPVSKRTKQIRAVISPHAGYSYSGPCAAWSYSQIAESLPADTYILLGPNHSGIGSSSISLDDWQTPFGTLRADKELGKALLKSGQLVEDAQAQEHAIEVQLPFLQFVNKDILHKMSILPIALRDDIDIHKLALDIKEAVLDSNKKAIFIVSSDFTHYGPNYSYVPFSSDVPKRLYSLDQGAIKLIKKLDAQRLVNYVNETGATICGILPILLLLKILGKGEGELLQYYTSADIVGDYKNAVGYASMVFG